MLGKLGDTGQNTLHRIRKELIKMRKTHFKKMKPMDLRLSMRCAFWAVFVPLSIVQSPRSGLQVPLWVFSVAA